MVEGFFAGLGVGFVVACALAVIYHLSRRDTKNPGDQSDASRIYTDVERHREEGRRIAEEAAAAGANLEDILRIVEHRPLHDDSVLNSEE